MYQEPLPPPPAPGEDYAVLLGHCCCFLEAFWVLGIWEKMHVTVPLPPRMVTCKLSRVWCRLSRRQHNMQHLQFTRVEEKLVKSRKRP